MSARVRAGPDPSRATGHRPFTNACLSFGGHDGRPHLDRPHAGPTQPRRVRCRLRRGRDEGPRRGMGDRLFDHDTTLWSSDERIQAEIAARLGWLEAPVHFADNAAGLEGFGDAVVAEGFTDVVVAGMGGSTLAPDVLNRTFGSEEGYPRAAHPRLDRSGIRLGDARRPRRAPDDDGHRDQVGHDGRAERLPRSCLGADRRSPRRDPSPHLRGPGRVHRRDHRSRSEPRRDPPPRRFPRDLPQPARHRRAVFGADLRRARARVAARPRPRRAARRCGDRDARRLPRAGPGRQPGRVAGCRPRHARAGRPRQADVRHRDRDRQLRRLGRSSSSPRAPASAGTGIVPVDLEPLGPPASYGPTGPSSGCDLADSDDATAMPSPTPSRRRPPGHPDRRWPLEGRSSAPGVRALGGRHRDRGCSARHRPLRPAQRRGVQGTDADRARDDRADGETDSRPEPATAEGGGLRLLRGRGPRRPPSTAASTPSWSGTWRAQPIAGYLALQAFIAPTPARDEALARIRRSSATGTRRATTSGYGPRFLHSTGQLHKGGPASGWFIQLTADHPADRPIPDWRLHVRPAHRRPVGR